MEAGPDFLGGSYKGYSTVVNPTRSVNMFTVLDNKGGKPISAQGTPGLKEFCRWGAATREDIDTSYTEVDAGSLLTLTDYTITGASLLRASTAHVSKDFTAGYFAADFIHKMGVKIPTFSNEILTDMTEVDASSKLTVTASTVTAASAARDTTACLYQDFGANYFSADFEHRFSFCVTAFDAYFPSMDIALWMLTKDNAATIQGIPTADGTAYGRALSVSFSRQTGLNTAICLEERAGASYGARSISNIVLGTTYYCKVVRKKIQDGGQIQPSFFSRNVGDV